MSHIVFLSLFLGLVSGLQPIEVRVSESVKSVRFFVDGKQVGLLLQPPWRTAIDFGDALDPREFQAIAYDERGDELGRATQTLNLKRPVAELQIVVHNDEHDMPGSVELVGRHLQFLKPKSAAIRLDGRKLKMKGWAAALPRIDWSQSHVISADMKFQDGLVARSETVISGGFSDSVGSQLTGVLLSGAKENQHLDDCLSVDGNALHVSAVEKTNALVTFIREPDPGDTAAALDRIARARDSSPALRESLSVDTFERFVWPVAREFTDVAARTVLYENSTEIRARRGLTGLLMTPMHPMPSPDEPRKFSDAVAVAAIQTYMPARRRAVVLILSKSAPDYSSHKPIYVRHYLERIGVPLFVWSFHGPRPDLADSWGEITDISSPQKYRDAVKKIRETVDKQSVAWVAADPLTALRVQAKDSCGITVVAAAK